MLLGVLTSVIVLAVIIGLIVYFTVFYHKGGDNNPEASKQAVKMTSDAVQRFVRSLRGADAEYIVGS